MEKKDQWPWTAASEQSNVAAYNVIGFLTIKISFGILLNVTLNVNTEFLKIAKPEPIVSTEQVWPWGP